MSRTARGNVPSARAGLLGYTFSQANELGGSDTARANTAIATIGGKLVTYSPSHKADFVVVPDTSVVTTYTEPLPGDSPLAINTIRARHNKRVVEILASGKPLIKGEVSVKPIPITLQCLLAWAQSGIQPAPFPVLWTTKPDSNAVGWTRAMVDRFFHLSTPLPARAAPPATATPRNDAPRNGGPRRGRVQTPYPASLSDEETPGPSNRAGPSGLRAGVSGAQAPPMRGYGVQTRSASSTAQASTSGWTGGGATGGRAEGEADMRFREPPRIIQSATPAPALEDPFDMSPKKLARSESEVQSVLSGPRSPTLAPRLSLAQVVVRFNLPLYLAPQVSEDIRRACVEKHEVALAPDEYQAFAIVINTRRGTKCTPSTSPEHYLEAFVRSPGGFVVMEAWLEQCLREDDFVEPGSYLYDVDQDEQERIDG